MGNFKYICAVAAGDRLYAAAVDRPMVCEGDLVILDNGVQGYVTRVAFMDAESEEFAILQDFVPLDEIEKVFRLRWDRDEEKEA